VKGIRSRLKRLEDKRPDRYEERCRGCGKRAGMVFEEHKDGEVIFNGFEPCPLCHELEAYHTDEAIRWTLICQDRGLGRHCRFCSGEVDSWSVG
jgi:hypothetical protein